MIKMEDKQKLKNALHETMEFAVSGLEKSVQFYLSMREAASEKININSYEVKVNRILRKFQPIVKPIPKKEMENYLKKPINSFDISSNFVKNSLKREGINTVEALASRTEPEIYSLRGVGNLNFRKLRKILTDRGLDFKKD